MSQYPSNNMKYSLRQNRGSSRYQPYPGLAGRSPQLSSQSSQSSSPSNSRRPAKLTRCNAVIFDRNLRCDNFATTETVTTHSSETTTSFGSVVPPPNTPTLDLTTASGTEVSSLATSFKAAGDNDEESFLGDDNESCISVSSSIVPINFPSRSFTLQPTSINLPPTFKHSVRKAVQRRLKRYAGKLDPNTSREVELGITEAIDLAIRILERTHRPNDVLPVSCTCSEVTAPSISARPPPAIGSPFLRDVTKSVLQGSLNMIRSGGRQILTALSPRTAPELTYEMTRLDVSISHAHDLIPGGWDRN